MDENVGHYDQMENGDDENVRRAKPWPPVSCPLMTRTTPEQNIALPWTQCWSALARVYNCSWRHLVCTYKGFQSHLAGWTVILTDVFTAPAQCSTQVSIAQCSQFWWRVETFWLWSLALLCCTLYNVQSALLRCSRVILTDMSPWPQDWGVLFIITIQCVTVVQLSFP